MTVVSIYFGFQILTYINIHERRHTDVIPRDTDTGSNLVCRAFDVTCSKVAFASLRPQTCTHISCNCSLSLRFWQPAVPNYSNGVSRPVHSESCCQRIRRKQVGNVPAAGKSQMGSRRLWLKNEKERKVVKIGHKQDCSVYRWFSLINLGSVSVAMSGRLFWLWH